MELENLVNITKKTGSKRVGRGPGSKRGKTSGRGHKGDKSRSGYKTRAGKEGGQLPLFQKLPHRGFSNERFKTPTYSIPIGRLNDLVADGALITKSTLVEKGFPKRIAKGKIKLLLGGEFDKKVVFKGFHYSKGVISYFTDHGIEYN